MPWGGDREDLERKRARSASRRHHEGGRFVGARAKRSVRLRHGGDAGTMSLDAFLAAAGRAVAARVQELTTEVKDR